MLVTKRKVYKPQVYYTALCYWLSALELMRIHHPIVSSLHWPRPRCLRYTFKWPSMPAKTSFWWIMSKRLELIRANDAMCFVHLHFKYSTLFVFWVMTKKAKLYSNCFGQIKLKIVLFPNFFLPFALVNLSKIVLNNTCLKTQRFVD